MSSVVVSCKGLAKAFGKVLAVSELDLTVERGRVLALLGPSGCGKTTLLRLVAGFEVPNSGTVELSGQMMAGPGVFLPPEKRRVGMVFQDYALFPHMTAKQNIAYGLNGWEREDQKRRIQEVLGLVHLSGLENRFPHQLSGGEQQRLALARALAPSPVVLLLDEPFSNLDPNLRSQVRGEVKEILAEAGTTSIFVTHDQEEALFMGDLIAVMSPGKIEQMDTPERIFHAPQTSFVARFMGIADFLPARVTEGEIMTEIGSVPLRDSLVSQIDLEIMVRPDDVGLRPLEGTGEITGRTFQGAFYLYTVRLPSGHVVRSLQTHTQRYPVGTPVEPFLVGDHNPVLFAKGRAVSLQKRGSGAGTETPAK